MCCNVVGNYIVHRQAGHIRSQNRKIPRAVRRGTRGKCTRLRHPGSRITAVPYTGTVTACSRNANGVCNSNAHYPVRGIAYRRKWCIGYHGRIKEAVILISSYVIARASSVYGTSRAGTCLAIYVRCYSSYGSTSRLSRCIDSGRKVHVCL